MSMLRISTKDPNRALSLKDYLSQNGLNVVMLSPTELEIEDGSVSGELGDEISSWRQSHDLEITVHSVAQSATQSPQPDEEWRDSETPQREFVFAPQWRSVRTNVISLGLRLAATRQLIQSFVGRLSTRLHETEERILCRSTASDKERSIAEEKAWADNVKPVERIQPAERLRPLEKIQLRQRIQSATTFVAGLSSAKWLTDGGKAVAVAGGIVMAGLIGIGLSVSHVDKASAGTSHPSSGSAAAAVVQTSAQPHQVRALASSPKQTAQLSKPSPVSTPHMAMTPHASPHAVAGPHEDLAEDNGPEVVTHYYNQKSVSQLRKTTYNGVKHYSDME